MRFSTYASAAHGYDEEALDDARRADDPRHADEQDHAENVLHAREVDAGQGAQLRRRLLLGRLGVVRVDGRLHRRAVIGQRADEGGHLGPAFLALLLRQLQRSKHVSRLLDARRTINSRRRPSNRAINIYMVEVQVALESREIVVLVLIGNERLLLVAVSCNRNAMNYSKVEKRISNKSRTLLTCTIERKAFKKC